MDVEFDVDDGETFVILGPSGSGKTLLLETIAGFVPSRATSEVEIVHSKKSGSNATRNLSDLPPEERNIGFVFQNQALFPHLTARQNVEFGTKYADESESPEPDKVLERLGISEVAYRTPDELSGGEKQRVGLARALVKNPDIFLLDEPLSSLDVPNRERLRDELVEILSNSTSIYVTHDRTTARVLGDRIGVMNDGRIEQVGTPEEVFESPQSRFVAEFTGANVFSANDLESFGISVPEEASYGAIRPEDVILTSTESDVTTARVERVTRENVGYRVILKFEKLDTRFEVYSSSPPSDELTGAEIPSEMLTFF